MRRRNVNTYVFARCTTWLCRGARRARPKPEGVGRSMRTPGSLATCLKSQDDTIPTKHPSPNHSYELCWFHTSIATPYVVVLQRYCSSSSHSSMNAFTRCVLRCWFLSSGLMQMCVLRGNRGRRGRRPSKVEEGHRWRIMGWRNARETAGEPQTIRRVFATIIHDSAK